MKPLGIVGLLILIAGIVVLAMNGVSYTKDKDVVKVGPIEVSAEKKGFIPPAAAIGAIIVGGVLVIAGRSRKA